MDRPGRELIVRAYLHSPHPGKRQARVQSHYGCDSGWGKTGLGSVVAKFGMFVFMIFAILLSSVVRGDSWMKKVVVL